MTRSKEKDNVVVQYKLKNVQTGAFCICWLDKDLKVGNRVTLRDKKGTFEITEKYGTANKSSLDLNETSSWY